MSRTSDPSGQAGSHAEAGVLLLVVAALAFSTAGVFTRLAPVGLGSMVFWRNSFGCLGLLPFVILEARSRSRAWRTPGVSAWSAMMCSAFATVCYLAAFGHTSVANISIIYATSPMIGAVLGWALLGERPGSRTLLAAGVALSGAVVTVAGSVSAGTVVGDGLAVAMTVALSGMAVLARGSVLPPVATAFGSSALAAIALLPVTLGSSMPLRIDFDEALWLALFGLVTMTLALPTYLAGARRVAAGRTMLISSLEMPFAPLWMWLAFGDLPSISSMLGGGLVLLAVAFTATGSRPSQKRGAAAPLS